MNRVAMPIRWICGLSKPGRRTMAALGLALVAVALALALPVSAQADPPWSYGPYYRPYAGPSYGFGPFAYPSYQPSGFPSYNCGYQPQMDWQMLRLWSDIQRMNAETSIYIAGNSIATSRYAADTIHRAFSSWK
jgi:hypothetical protein